VKKERILEEKKRLLNLIERKEQIEQRQMEEAAAKSMGDQHSQEWNKKQSERAGAVRSEVSSSQ
jgi:RNA polymerase-binding transcription factor DksA